MNLTSFRNTIVSEYFNENCSEMRRLAIGMEIVSLPPLLVFDEPTRSLEPSVASEIFKSLKALAARGHIVVCGLYRPTASLFRYIDSVVVIAEGQSMFSSQVSNIVPFFSTAGYIYNKDVNVADFVLDIASGLERPGTSRNPPSVIALRESFEKSAYFSNSISGLNSVSALPRHGYLSDTFTVKNLCNIYGGLKLLFYRVMNTCTIVERSVLVKVRDRPTLMRSLFSAAFGGKLR
jgi:energy-coupling factor transporter ATP-binding protein EcfA2